MDKIIICMGSSCFSRGNSDMVESVKSFIKDNHLENNVEISGCLCKGLCKNGPNLEINGKLFHNVTPETLNVILTDGLHLN